MPWPGCGPVSLTQPLQHRLPLFAVALDYTLAAANIQRLLNVFTATTGAAGPMVLPVSDHGYPPGGWWQQARWCRGSPPAPNPAPLYLSMARPVPVSSRWSNKTAVGSMMRWLIMVRNGSTRPVRDCRRSGPRARARSVCSSPGPCFRMCRLSDRWSGIFH